MSQERKPAQLDAEQTKLVVQQILLLQDELKEEFPKEWSEFLLQTDAAKQIATKGIQKIIIEKQQKEQLSDQTKTKKWSLPKKISEWLQNWAKTVNDEFENFKALRQDPRVKQLPPKHHDIHRRLKLSDDKSILENGIVTDQWIKDSLESTRTKLKDYLSQIETKEHAKKEEELKPYLWLNDWSFGQGLLDNQLQPTTSKHLDLKNIKNELRSWLEKESKEPYFAILSQETKDQISAAAEILHADLTKIEETYEKQKQEEEKKLEQTKKDLDNFKNKCIDAISKYISESHEAIKQLDATIKAEPASLQTSERKKQIDDTLSKSIQDFNNRFEGYANLTKGTDQITMTLDNKLTSPIDLRTLNSILRDFIQKHKNFNKRIPGLESEYISLKQKLSITRIEQAEDQINNFPQNFDQEFADKITHLSMPKIQENIKKLEAKLEKFKIAHNIKSQPQQSSATSSSEIKELKGSDVKLTAKELAKERFKKETKSDRLARKMREQNELSDRANAEHARMLDEEEARIKAEQKMVEEKRIQREIEIQEKQEFETKQRFVQERDAKSDILNILGKAELITTELRNKIPQDLTPNNLIALLKELSETKINKPNKLKSIFYNNINRIYSMALQNQSRLSQTEMLCFIRDELLKSDFAKLLDFRNPKFLFETLSSTNLAENKNWDENYRKFKRTWDNIYISLETTYSSLQQLYGQLREIIKFKPDEFKATVGELASIGKELEQYRLENLLNNLQNDNQQKLTEQLEFLFRLHNKEHFTGYDLALASSLTEEKEAKNGVIYLSEEKDEYAVRDQAGVLRKGLFNKQVNLSELKEKITNPNLKSKLLPEVLKVTSKAGHAHHEGLKNRVDAIKKVITANFAKLNDDSKIISERKAATRREIIKEIQNFARIAYGTLVLKAPDSTLTEEKERMDQKEFDAEVDDLNRIFANVMSIIKTKTPAETNLFLMSTPQSGKYKNSDSKNLYLYKDKNDEIFYQIHDKPFKLWSQKNQIPQNFKELAFNQPESNPVKCEDLQICTTVLNITAALYHTSPPAKNSYKFILDKSLDTVSDEKLNAILDNLLLDENFESKIRLMRAKPEHNDFISDDLLLKISDSPRTAARLQSRATAVRSTSHSLSLFPPKIVDVESNEIKDRKDRKEIKKVTPTISVRNILENPKPFLDEVFDFKNKDIDSPERKEWDSKYQQWMESHWTPFLSDYLSYRQKLNECEKLFEQQRNLGTHTSTVINDHLMEIKKSTSKTAYVLLENLINESQKPKQNSDRKSNQSQKQKSSELFQLITNPKESATIQNNQIKEAEPSLDDIERVLKSQRLAWMIKKLFVDNHHAITHRPGRLGKLKRATVYNDVMNILGKNLEPKSGEGYGEMLKKVSKRLSEKVNKRSAPGLYLGENINLGRLAKFEDKKHPYYKIFAAVIHALWYLKNKDPQYAIDELTRAIQTLQPDWNPDSANYKLSTITPGVSSKTSVHEHGLLSRKTSSAPEHKPGTEKPTTPVTSEHKSRTEKPAAPVARAARAPTQSGRR